MDYTEHLKVYKFLQRQLGQGEAIRFNRIADHRLPHQLTKNEYVTALLVLVKGIPKGYLAKESGVKDRAIDMRMKRAMTKLMCTDVLQLREEIKRIEASL